MSARKWAFAFASAGSLVALAACSVVPQAPVALREDWIPEVSPSPLAQDALDAPFGFSIPERAAYRVRNDGCEGIGTGSGFAIDDHTIITNRHVIDGRFALEVTGYDGRNITVVSSTVSDIADIGVIITEEPLDLWVSLASTDPGRGDEIVTAGYPRGDELRVDTGVVVGKTDDVIEKSEFVFQTTAQIEPGSSGSAVYGKDGHVVGVIYASDDDEAVAASSYMVPVSILINILADDSLLRNNAAAC